MLPKLYIPALVMLACLVVMLAIRIKKHEWNKLGVYACAFIYTNILLLVIPCMAESFYFPCREAFCIYLIHGLMLVTLLVEMENRQMLYAFSCVIGGYCMLMLLIDARVCENRYLSNSLDVLYANMIVNRIEDYEATTGDKITRLATVGDADSPNVYNEVHYAAQQINERVITQAPCSMLWYVSRRRFESEPMDQEIYNLYFDGKNWDEINLDEQLVIVDDTAYLCNF